MDKFFAWMKEHESQITWFVIGWLTFVGLSDLFAGKYGWGIVCLLLAFINYKIEKWKK